MIPTDFRDAVIAIVGEAFVKSDAEALEAYGVDSLKRGHAADLVALPCNTAEVSQLARLCTECRVPIVVRGAGTGYTGGAVPVLGGLVISMERMNRILEIDTHNLLAVVEPNVITGDLQDAAERVGLFYPPDPASLRESTIGGNVAECAGGPRAFKYGTTRHYVLALEAVLPSGEVIKTGSKAVKNVVGYDLTQLLIGSEGTLAIITRIVLRLVPRPPVQTTLRATFRDVRDAVGAVDALVRALVVPATLELVDRDSLEAVATYVGAPLAPAGTGALLILEVDGFSGAVAEQSRRVEEACRAAGATEILRADTPEEREALWRVRREISPALKTISPAKINHDLVVPRGRVPELFDLIDRTRRRFDLRVACFGHAGDGNIHVNIMVNGDDLDEIGRALQAERLLFEGVVALEGSISGEHGIGFAKAKYLPIELSPPTIAVMKRIKKAFDPTGILNPGKIFPE